MGYFWVTPCHKGATEKEFNMKIPTNNKFQDLSIVTTMNTTPKNSPQLIGRRLLLAALTGLLIFFSSFDHAEAQFQTVEDLLTSASVGGTRGYRLRRIGSNSPAGSQNTNYVYYPASSIKVLQGYFAMSKVEDGDWSLFGTNLDVCTSANENCSAVVNASAAGCVPITEDLSTVITGMMVPSNNQRTNAIQEQAGQDFWPAGAPFSNDRASYGRSSMNSFASGDLGMTSTALNHKFGCAGACSPVPNTATLTDMDRCYSNIAWNTAIMSPGNRMEFYDRSPNSTTWLNTLVDEEAADLNKQTHAAAFKAKMYSMNKGGSWTCGGGGYYSNAGLVQLPTYNGAFKRLFVWGTFIDGTDAALYNSATHSAANRELLRYAIRGALLTWSLPWHPGDKLPGYTTDVGNVQSGLSPSSAEYYFLGLAMQHLGNATPTTNDSFPPIKPPLEEMEQASYWIQLANQSLSNPTLDSVILWVTDLGINMAEDALAWAVAAGEGSRLESGCYAMGSKIGEARKEMQRGNHTQALQACIDAAGIGEPLTLQYIPDSTEPTQSIGFYPILPPRRKMADQVMEMPSEITVAPNPSNGEFRIRLEALANTPAELVIYDLQGRKVADLYRGALQENTPVDLVWNPNSQSDGLYFARLTTDHGVSNLKLILQR